MKQPNVHILVSVRNAKLMHAALLVFKTLRTGFPTANVYAYGNGLSGDAAKMVARAAYSVGVNFKHIARTTHGRWIEELVMSLNEPFWICDTDVVFFGSMEESEKKGGCGIFAGRFEPEFMEEWTGTRHAARLHPSLMRFDPCPLRAVMRYWPGVHEFFLTVKREFFEWQFVPYGDEVLFYDTCAVLHQAFGGARFTDAQNERFEHLHCGSYSDLIGPSLSLQGDMAEKHRAIYMQPELARGLQIEQRKYYASRKPWLVPGKPKRGGSKLP